MSDCDILLQIGTGAMAGVAAGLVLLTGKHALRYFERRRQIKALQKLIVQEFGCVANMAGLPSFWDRPDTGEGITRLVAAHAGWVRLRATADYYTDSLKADEKASLHRSLNSLEADHRSVKGRAMAYSRENLQELYQMVATDNKWLKLKPGAQWE